MRKVFFCFVLFFLVWAESRKAVVGPELRCYKNEGNKWAWTKAYIDHNNRNYEVIN